jgi:hypothetical protein
MNEFLVQDVIPTWKEKISKISQKQRILCIKQGRNHFIDKEFCKDVRSFYRIMFRLRFHRSDKREDGNNSVMVKAFLKEIGILYEPEEDFDELFIFFYKVHYNQRKQDFLNLSMENKIRQVAQNNDVLYRK